MVNHKYSLLIRTAFLFIYFAHARVLASSGYTPNQCSGWFYPVWQRCFQIVQTRLTWTAAQTACRAANVQPLDAPNGRLAVFLDAATAANVSAYVRSQSLSDDVYIGKQQNLFIRSTAELEAAQMRVTVAKPLPACP